MANSKAIHCDLAVLNSAITDVSSVSETIGPAGGFQITLNMLQSTELADKSADLETFRGKLYVQLETAQKMSRVHAKYASTLRKIQNAYQQAQENAILRAMKIPR